MHSSAASSALVFRVTSAPSTIYCPSSMHTDSITTQPSTTEQRHPTRKPSEFVAFSEEEEKALH